MNMNFSHRLIEWYNTHKRVLPWRATQDPYAIWLSEIILQQTRVNQGLPYYLKFIKAFPTVNHLAHSSQEKVLKLWQGLGYYSRARNLHAAAQQVVEQGSFFPDSYKKLLDLKGVGDYTASAIASFAYNEAVPVVDGNVYRVLSRIYGVSTPINSTPGIKEFKELATQLLNKEDPATHNQAIMEFGALHCVPKNPDCSTCVFNDVCVAREQNRVTELPVKLSKTKVKNLFYHYLVVQTPAGHTLLRQRNNDSIWAGLYEFPYVESQGAMMPFELISDPVFEELFGELRFRESNYNQQPIIHKLSHRKIHAYFWIVTLEEELNDGISILEAFKKPVPVLIDRFMKNYWQADI
jgi:A/G-specific adenine glycosylase